jgi:enoyl-CoA hydratase
VSGKYIQYELVDDGAIARIVLNRPKYRNAQNRGLLVELGEAFARAEADDSVRVVILSGAGPMFSTGHDLGSPDQVAGMAPGPDQHPTFASMGATRQGAEARMLQEWHFFFENTKRWRNLNDGRPSALSGSTSTPVGGDRLPRASASGEPPLQASA